MYQNMSANFGVFMKTNKVNVQVVPDLRTKVDNRFSLKLRITYKGTRKYYSTGYAASEEEWMIMNSAESKNKLRQIRNAIVEIETAAEKCCANITPFSYKEFEYSFFDKKLIFETLISAYASYIDQLKVNQQYSTSMSYQTAVNNFEKFRPNLKLEDITIEFLENFERWMLGRGKSITTVGMHIRTLRAVLNIAKENGAITQQGYPFGRRKYIIPTGKNTKKALAIHQIEQIFDYPTAPDTTMEKSRDFWVLSYLCNGMNMADIASLRWGDLQGEIISFERQKTKRSLRGNPVKITILRNDLINKLIDKYCNKKWSNHNAYIFDIIAENDNAEAIRKKVNQFTQVTNKWTKDIGKELKFNLTLTTYVARHSFATILLRSGAPITFASQSLGHTSIMTTQKYFAGFDLAAQAEYMKALTPFLRK